MNTDPSTHEGSGHTENPASDPSSAGPARIDEAVDRKAGGQPSRDESGKHFYYDKGGIPRKWEIGIGAFLAFVNFAALFIYLYQLIEMRKATEAATQGLALTREMNRLDERAWLSVVGITGTPEAGKLFTVEVTTKNNGKTFARKSSIKVVAEWFPRGQRQPDFSKEEAVPWTKGETPAVSLVAPNDGYITTIVLEALGILTEEHVKEIISGELIVYIHGKITYRDIFNCPHWTKFCYIFRGNRFRVCEEHNDDDSDRCP